MRGEALKSLDCCECICDLKPDAWQPQQEIFLQSSEQKHGLYKKPEAVEAVRSCALENNYLRGS